MAMTLLRFLACLVSAGLLLSTAPPPLSAASSTDEEDDGAVLKLPDKFMIGAATSAYQIEGAWNISGKSISNLDVANDNRTDHGGEVACDSYNRYKDDIAMLKLMGATHYRFSIAWTRLLPNADSEVNADGERYYNAILDELEANGIEALVTLHHFDIPMVLENTFGGWTSKRIVPYFETFARTAFKLFGKRVRFWTTLNEPLTFCVIGAEHGRLGTTVVKAGVTEYLSAHNMLLAHATAYRVYKNEFASQGGMVGLTVNNLFTRPCSTEYDDVRAAERHMQFELGWFLEPLLKGGVHPPQMLEYVPPERLPTFDDTERELLSGAVDFIGLNSYYGGSACNGVPENSADPSYERDKGVVFPEASDPNSPMLSVAFQWNPWTIRSTLRWIRDRYDPENKIPVIVTENGYSGDEGLHDTTRVAYLSNWLRSVLRAIHKDKVNVIGYFVWSLLDNFEWGVGFQSKYGLVQVDFSSPNLTRTAKDSLYFMKDVISSREVPLKARPNSSSSHLAPTFTLFAALLLLLWK